MEDWAVFLLGLVLIIICMVLIVVTKKLDVKWKIRMASKKRAKKIAAGEEVPEEEDPYAGYEVGRIYQMENGDLAKYIGDGKFLRVKK